jgi:hypothetical protein
MPVHPANYAPTANAWSLVQLGKPNVPVYASIPKPTSITAVNVKINAPAARSASTALALAHLA